MPKGYKVRYKVSGKKYKTIAGYTNAVFNKYRNKIDEGFKTAVEKNKLPDWNYSEKEMKKIFRNSIKSEMANDPELSLKQATSKVLNSRTFTSAEEMTQRRFVNDFKEFRIQLEYEKNHRFRDEKGHFISAKQALGAYDTGRDVPKGPKVRESGYHFVDYRPTADGKLERCEYLVNYNYSPKPGEQRWQITRVKQQK